MNPISICRASCVTKQERTSAYAKSHNDVATEMNDAIWETPAGRTLLDGFARGRVMEESSLGGL